MSKDFELAWREIVSRHQAAMVDDLSARLTADLDEAVAAALTTERAQSQRTIARACEETRRAHSESLNQALRRLRAATSEEKTLELLKETCGAHAERCFVLVFSDGHAHAGDVAFRLDEAPAVTSAIESRDPMVTVASADQLSPALARAFSGDAEEDVEGPGRAFLFPLIVRHAAVGMLVAAGQVEPSPVELLCEAAAMRLEALRIDSFGAPDPGKPVAASSWEELSADDQRLHLQAQRVARVRVAEIRLSEEEALQRGLAASNLYGVMQSRIDEARREFLQSFLSKSATMVDYLHLEILRSLVRDNAKLLGPDYPGPMV